MLSPVALGVLGAALSADRDEASRWSNLLGIMAELAVDPDGLTEARGAAEVLYGMQRFSDLISMLLGRSPIGDQNLLR